MPIPPPPSGRLWQTACASLGVWAILAGGVEGAPPGGNDDQRFYDRLLEEGHTQLAAEMLVRAESDPLVSESFRQTARYQRIDLDILRALGSKEGRSNKLEALAEQIDQLANEGPPEGALVAFARTSGRLASATADDARRQALDARNLPQGKTRQRRLQVARQALLRAEKRLAEAAKLYEQEHKKLRGVQPQSAEGRLRLDLLGRLAQTRLVAARLLHDRAMTYEADSETFDRLHREGAKQLGALYEKYSKWVVGLYAHLYEGACYRALGETPLAAACFEDLIAQPTTTTELRRIVTHAHAELAATWVDADDPAKAITVSRPTLESLGNDQHAEGALLRYHLGRAQLAIARTLEPGTPQRRATLRDADAWLASAAATPSEVRHAAREAWSQVAALRGEEQFKPKDFDEAYRAAKRAIDSLASARAAIDASGGETSAEPFPAQADSASSAARQALKAALRLIDAKTDPQQVSEVRYLLAWIAWDAGELQHVAKMAEFFARNPSDDAWNARGARLGLVALQRLALEGGEEAEAAGKRLVALARQSVERWPTGPTAESAVSVLLSDALQRGQVDEAERLVESLDPRQRPVQALRLATVRWERQLAGTDPADRQASFERLTKALEEIRKAVPAHDEPVVIATLHVAREHLERGEGDVAVALLTETETGPYQRLQRNEAPADQDRFAALTAETAVRAAVATGAQALANAHEQFDQVLAQQSDEQQLRSRLTIAVTLMENLAALGPAVQTRTAETVAKLLIPVSESRDAEDWNTRTWIAQTIYRLAELPLDTALREAYLRRAGEAFRVLIDSAEADPSLAPNEAAMLAVQLRAAQCERQLGNHREALLHFERLLAERPALVEVQEAAARTLQAWGLDASNREHLEAAIGGTRPDSSGKNIVWGWRKLATVASRATSSNPKYEKLFYEAWLEVARSRYLVGTLASGSEREANLRKAANTLRSMQRQYPGLGGEAMQRRYDQLLSTIEGAL